MNNRRKFLKGILLSSIGISFKKSFAIETFVKKEYDYIIIGSGPGGGPLASNLANAGYSVALIEAGLDPISPVAQSINPYTKTVYRTPGFFGGASEHPLLSWDIFVNHYSNLEQQQKDPKYVEGKGVLYPRGSCLGGSSSHNALIFTYPHDSDFDFIAKITKDESWASKNMRKYFTRIENCQYCGSNTNGHGLNGYIPSSMNNENAYDIFPMIKDLTLSGVSGKIGADINMPEVAKGLTGAYKMPMNVDISTKRRVAIRERIMQAKKLNPNNFDIITNALATKVITQKQGNKIKAVGIEFLNGGGMSYKAHKFNKTAPKGVKTIITAKREVILCGGAFNTPQLLKLSGIGPKDELIKHGIDVVKDLQGVGNNLQDRYESPVIFSLNKRNDLFQSCKPFQENDPCLQSYKTGQWIDEKGITQSFSGPYAGNDIFASRIMKSSVAKGEPDIFLVGIPLAFKGYYPNYSNEPFSDHWTWNVLKVHTNNTAGKVELKSTDPTDTPLINFHYFEEGNDKDGSDLKAVVEGIKYVRHSMSQPLAQKHIKDEYIPGASFNNNAKLEKYVRDVSWGHHASCTAKIGADNDKMAVLDSKFRVRGIDGLRVVDASVFPKTPGFFPTAAIIMISEKASDVIIEDAKNH